MKPKRPVWRPVDAALLAVGLGLVEVSEVVASPEPLLLEPVEVVLQFGLVKAEKGYKNRQLTKGWRRC